MKFKLLIYTGLALSIIIIFGGFFALQNLNTEQPVDESRTVYVKNTEDGHHLIRNGEPFYIQGVGGESNFKELAEIGGNTIRLYDTLDLQNKLEEAHKYGLAVIVDIPIPEYSELYNSYEDEDENAILKRKIKDLVKQHKDHPALLIWNLGNELNYPLVFRKNDFINTFNELLSLIKDEDPNHPVSTSIIGVGRKTVSSIYLHSPEIDLVSFNTFGNTIYIKSHLAQISLLFGSRPYFFGEYGPDGPWESSSTSWGAPIEATSSMKSERIRTRFELINEVEDGGNLGSLMFYWGNKLERTHTWFSLFHDGYKSEVINVIETMWQQPDSTSELVEMDYMLINKISNKNSHHDSIISPDELRHSDVNPDLIGLDYMLLNEMSADENIIFAPGDLGHAEIFFNENKKDSVQIEWEIYPEAWFSDTREIVVSNYKPIDSFVNFKKNKTTFRVPTKEGPYRIFAYIYNQEDFFATVNIPFYVLKD